MSIPFSITSQTGQPAAAGGTGGATAQKGESNAFSSLLATLFALTSPGQAQPGAAPANGETAIGQTGESQFKAALLGLQADMETGAANGKPGDMLGAMVENLNKALEKLLNGADASEIDAGLQAEIAKAIEALTAFLETAASNPQGLSAQQAALLPQADPAAGAQSAAEGSPRLEAALGRLQDLTGKLTEAAPKLAETAEKLLQRLAEALPAKQPQPATATPVAQAPADAESANLAATVSQLLGGRPIKPNGDSAQSGSNERDARTAATTQKSDTDLGKTLADIAKTGTDAEKPTHRPGGAAGAAAAAAQGANIGSTGAAVDISGQSDILLQVQSTSVSRLDGGAIPKQMTAAYQGANPNLNLPHIAFEIASQFRQGVSRFQVRLDPPEMGKIDVRMDVDGAGNLHARLTVERAETLDLLQRDARALERALAQAGLDGAKTNLEFSLKQNPFARQDGGDNHGMGKHAFGADDLADNEEVPAGIPAVTIYRGFATPGGVNMLA